MSDINVVKSTANGYAVVPDMLVTVGSANVPFAVVTTADWPRVKVQNLIDGTLQSVDGSELVAASRDQLPFVKGQEVFVHLPNGTMTKGVIESAVGEDVEGGTLLNPQEWSFGIRDSEGSELPFMYLHSISCGIVKAGEMATMEFETTPAAIADDDGGETVVPDAGAPTKVKRVRKPKAKPEAPVFVNPLAMSAEELRQNALDRITKPGVVAIAAGHGLIRVRSKGETSVLGVTATHVDVEVPFEDLAPATKSQVDQYRELFKEVAKTVPPPLNIGDAVASKGKPKKLLGYVNFITKTGLYGIVLVDGSDEGEELERDDIVAFTGKEPRFADVPLFGAFIFKGKTHVKVAKSNAIAVEVKGLSASPVAVLATESSKLGSAAFKRFKKDDRVQPYAQGLVGLLK